MKRLAYFTLLFLALLPFNRVIASEPIQRLFHQWQVTCNNLNDCDIRNTNPDENIRVVLQYEAGPKGAIFLELAGYDSDRPKGIWIDGQPWLNQLTPQDANSQHEGAGFRSDNLAKIQNFLIAIKNAHTVAISDDTDEGAALEGLNAALMFTDDRQGRTNNRTALINAGKGKVDEVPLRYAFEPILPRLAKPIPLPVEQAQTLIKGVLESQSQVLNDEDCTPEDETLAKSSAEPLDAQQALVMINCVSGAYQSSALLFITPRHAPELAKELELSVPLRDENGEPITINWFTNVDYNPQTGFLKHIAQGRGIADCGESAVWHFNGKSFDLMSYHNQPICDGGEPGNWPSVWLIPGYREHHHSLKHRSLINHSGYGP